MINKRRKYLPYKLTYYRTPISNIPNKLFHGEIISVTEKDGTAILLSYRGKTRGKYEFLQTKEFLDQKLAAAKTKQQDLKNAETDEFVLYVQNLKVEVGCAIPNCNSRSLNYPHYKFDYDHIDKSKKDHEICNLLKRYKQAITKVTKEKLKKMILQEITNCQVLCVSCHRDKTYLERNGDHICFSNYNSIAEFLMEKNLSPEPKYYMSIEDFIVTQK